MQSLIWSRKIKPVFVTNIRDEYGNFVNTLKYEYPEQSIVNNYIQPNDIVLELGARYGSVSCVINSKLSNKFNQVVVEPDSRVWSALDRNKQANKCGFNIVKGFLSSNPRTLIKMNSNGGYGTTSVGVQTSDISSFSLEEIQKIYGLTFNVLVADCEGFLGEFFIENPDFCNSLRLVIFEADYPDKCDYKSVRMMLSSKGFKKELEGHQNVWVRIFNV
jgi:FkbM family methyltransferase